MVQYRAFVKPSEDILRAAMDNVRTGANQVDQRPYDKAHLCEGLGLILNYLNNGNSCRELVRLKCTARLWCQKYYKQTRFERRKPELVLEHHPLLFDWSLPSWLRLQKGALHEEEPFEQEHQEDDGPIPFPAYSEPVMISDQEAYTLLDLYDEQHASDEPKLDRYSDYRVPLTGNDLYHSPILMHIPEIVCNMSFMRASGMLGQDPLGIYRTIRDRARPSPEEPTKTDSPSSVNTSNSSGAEASVKKELPYPSLRRVCPHLFIRYVDDYDND